MFINKSVPAVFGRSQFKISAPRSANLTDVFREFPLFF